MEVFNDKSRPRPTELKDKINSFESSNALCEDWELVLNAFKSVLFLIQSTQSKGLPSDFLQTSSYQ